MTEHTTDSPAGAYLFLGGTPYRVVRAATVEEIWDLSFHSYNPKRYMYLIVHEVGPKGEPLGNAVCRYFCHCQLIPTFEGLKEAVVAHFRKRAKSREVSAKRNQRKVATWLTGASPAEAPTDRQKERDRLLQDLKIANEAFLEAEKLRESVIKKIRFFLTQEERA